MPHALSALSRSLSQCFHGRQQQLEQDDKPATPPPSPSPCFLLSLPTDLLVYLLRTLPASVTAGLSLTCRTMWTLAGTVGVRPLEQLLATLDERWEFLRPQQGCWTWRNHVLCYECGQFHRRWHPLTTRECYRDKCYWLQCSFYETVPFMRVADMMNKHRYGAGFGLPTRDFEYNFSQPGPYQYGVEKTIRCLRMRVADNMAIAMLDMSELLDRDRVRHPASMYWSHRALFIRLLAQLDKDNNDTTAFARCRHCNADVRLQLDSVGLRRTVHRRCTVWIPLGTCERRDAVWERALADCFYPHPELLAGPDTFVWSNHFAQADRAPLYCEEQKPYYTNFDACWPTINGKRGPLPRPRGWQDWCQNTHI